MEKIVLNAQCVARVAINELNKLHDAILQKIAEYAERYGVEYIIDIIPLGIK